MNKMAFKHFAFLVALALTFTFHESEGGEDLLGPSYFHLVLKVESYILPFLKYSTMMLEPHLDAKGVEQHYEGHHEQYRRKMNAVLSEWRKEQPDSELARESILHILQHLDQVPEKYRQTVKNQGGGYVNHCFLFGILSPNLESETREPTGYLADELVSMFGGFEEFQSAFEKDAEKVFGSGYVWLVRNSQGTLEIMTTANEDSPISSGAYPVLVLDLWEHAYQTKHVFHRENYVRDWWNVVDWDKVAKLDQWGQDLVQKQAQDGEEGKDEL